MNKNAPVWTPKSQTSNSNDSVQETVQESQSTSSMETTSNNQNTRGQNRRPRNRGQGKPRRGNREAPQQNIESSTQEIPKEQTSNARGQRGRGRGYRNSRGNQRKPSNNNSKNEVKEKQEVQENQLDVEKIPEGKVEAPKLEKSSDSSTPKQTQVLKKKVDGSGHSTLAADIIERLNNDTYECMICCDTIKKKVAIWHCTNCFHLFHLFCIKKWGKSSDDAMTDGKFGSWRCPGCQHVYLGKPVPRCYCGKTTDPQFDPYFVPHSCGETCGKKRVNSECPHPCPLMCHPGHCPPCAQNGPLKTCYCGKQSYRLRCGEKDKGRACGQVCNKNLNCGLHQCMDLCHEGPCKPCLVKVKQTCYCGRACEEKLCGSGKIDHFHGDPRYFSCGSICAANLTCGHHQCESKCHPGSCSDCKLLPKVVTTCPCGKIPLQILYESLKISKRKSCIDQVPTCPNTCDKLLTCGVHNCKSKCHNGPCPPCTEETKAPCRCHSTSVTLPCNVFTSMKEPILCNKVCKAMRVCGRHTCGNRCCPSSHLADPAGLDTEGVHICNLVCGKKLKCGKHKCDLLCHAGKCPPCHVTIHEPYVCECGQTKVEPPILCGQKIPACQGICVRPRACGHPNKHTCHSRDEECPPCPVIVERTCSGGHDVKRYVACHLKDVSCGRICRKLLSCGQHNCKRLCHADACMSTPSCGQLCGKKLPCCEHSCQSICHPGDECPRIPCKQMITITCPCKRRSAEVECMRNGENDIGEPAKRELICDDICEMEARNRRLAEAFGHVPEKKEDYSDFLIDLGKASPLFIAKIEKKFEEFLKSPNSKYSFPSMDRIQRRIIHELATKYNFETESFDKEPNRNVVISKRKNSKMPAVTLSSIISQIPKYSPSSSDSNMNTSVPVPVTYAIHLSELSQETKTQHITFFLRPFEPRYQLKWLDDFNALVLFTDYNDMKAALYVLNGPFHATEYKDYVEVNSVDSGSANVTPKIIPKAKPLPVYEAPSKGWAEDKNYFSAFHSTAWDEETKEKEKNEQPIPQKSVESTKGTQEERDSWETLNQST